MDYLFVSIVLLTWKGKKSMLNSFSKNRTIFVELSLPLFDNAQLEDTFGLKRIDPDFWYWYPCTEIMPFLFNLQLFTVRSAVNCCTLLHAAPDDMHFRSSHVMDSPPHFSINPTLSMNSGAPIDVT